jgi:prevent-host-death family protein
MTKVFNLYEAKNQLSSLVERAAAGEEIIIAKHGQPRAKLVPVKVAKKEPRKQANLLGLTYMADDFDAPLPPELLKQFGYDPGRGLAARYPCLIRWTARDPRLLKSARSAIADAENALSSARPVSGRSRSSGHPESWPVATTSWKSWRAQALRASPSLRAMPTWQNRCLFITPIHSTGF